MSDRLRAGKPPPYVTSHTDQLSLLPSVIREMSTGKSALRVGSKGRHDSFHMWVAGKTVIPR